MPFEVMRDARGEWVRGLLRLFEDHGFCHFQHKQPSQSIPSNCSNG